MTAGHDAAIKASINKFWRYYESDPLRNDIAELVSQAVDLGVGNEVADLRERVEALETVLGQLISWVHSHDPESRGI